MERMNLQLPGRLFSFLTVSIQLPSKIMQEISSGDRGEDLPQTEQMWVGNMHVGKKEGVK